MAEYPGYRTRDIAAIGAQAIERAWDEHASLVMMNIVLDKPKSGLRAARTPDPDRYPTASFFTAQLL